MENLHIHLIQLSLKKYPFPSILYSHIPVRKSIAAPPPPPGSAPGTGHFESSKKLDMVDKRRQNRPLVTETGLRIYYFKYTAIIYNKLLIISTNKQTCIRVLRCYYFLHNIMNTNIHIERSFIAQGFHIPRYRYIPGGRLQYKNARMCVFGI